MADDKLPVQKVPDALGEAPVYPKGKPMTLADIMSPRAKEYIRAPGFIPGQVAVLQNLTAGDLIEWSEASEGSEQKRLAGLRLIIKSTVDGEPGVDPHATGRLLMDEQHLGILKECAHKHTEAIVKAILKHNGMRVKGDSDAKNE